MNIYICIYLLASFNYESEEVYRDADVHIFDEWYCFFGHSGILQ